MLPSQMAFSSQIIKHAKNRLGTAAVAKRDGNSHLKLQFQSFKKNKDPIDMQLGLSGEQITIKDGQLKVVNYEKVFDNMEELMANE